ncbi:TPA: EpsG family protein, partial [Mannheimia haemolytica]
LCILFYYADITGTIINILNDNLNNFSFIRRVHYYYFVKESGATMEFTAFVHRIAMLFLILFYFYKVDRKVLNLISLYFILFFTLANVGILAGRVSALFLLCYMCYFSNLICSLRKDHRIVVAIIMVLYFLIIFYKDLFRVHHIFGNDVYLPYQWIFM